MGPQPEDDEHPQPGYWLEIVMVEGRKREIREMLGALGYRVLRLVRIAHGPIRVGTLKPGEVRALTEEETDRLIGGETANAPGEAGAPLADN
jgi:23S rRNA pseudouridine2605 synthase